MGFMLENDAQRLQFLEHGYDAAYEITENLLKVLGDNGLLTEIDERTKLLIQRLDAGTYILDGYPSDDAMLIAFEEPILIAD